MPRLSDMFPSRYLKAEDLEEDGLIVTVKDITVEKMTDGTDKMIINFKEGGKGLACNKTNANTIAKLYGDDTDDWEGQKIHLFPSTCDYMGETVECIRVKPRKPKPEVKTTAARSEKVTGNNKTTTHDPDDDESDAPF